MMCRELRKIIQKFYNDDTQLTQTCTDSSESEDKLIVAFLAELKPWIGILFVAL